MYFYRLWFPVFPDDKTGIGIPCRIWRLPIESSFSGYSSIVWLLPNF